MKKTLGAVKKQVHCHLVEGRLVLWEGLQRCKPRNFYKMSTSPIDRTWKKSIELEWSNSVTPKPGFGHPSSTPDFPQMHSGGGWKRQHVQEHLNDVKILFIAHLSLSSSEL